MRVSRLLLLAPLFLAACGGPPPGENATDTVAVDENLSGDPAGESPAPRVFCDVIKERVTTEDCEDLRALRGDVRTGAAALDVPDPMTRGRTSEVTLTVDRRPLRQIEKLDSVSEGPAGEDHSPRNGGEPADPASVNAVEELPTTTDSGDSSAAPDDNDPGALTPNQVAAELPGTDHAFRSRVGRYMKATLVGQGFKIRLISPDSPIQEIAAGGQGTWIWEVMPEQDGNRTLTARTEAVGLVNGRTVPLGDGRTSKTIRVEVRAVDQAWDFLTALPGWFKLLTTVLGAAAALLLAWLQLRKHWRNRDQK